MIKNKFAKFFQHASNEKGIAKLIQPINLILERTKGKLRGVIFGWKNGHIGTGSRIIGSKFIETGDRCSIGKHSWIEAIPEISKDHSLPLIKIGSRFSGSERLHIACVNKVIIGEDCLFGSSVHITDHNHGSYKGILQSPPITPPIKRNLESTGCVTIGSNVWIGDNVVIIGPVTIGDGSIIGANSTVKKSIPKNTIAVGSPAIPVKYFDEQKSKWINQANS